LTPTEITTPGAQGHSLPLTIITNSNRI